MLGFAAAVLFAIAFVIYATSTSTITVLSPTSLLLAGLACLALNGGGRAGERQLGSAAAGSGVKTEAIARLPDGWAAKCPKPGPACSRSRRGRLRPEISIRPTNARS
jgi:hypothetical protein